MATRTLVNPLSGDRLTLLVTCDESAGELFRFEYETHAVSPLPDDHVHAEQQERVEVLEGTLVCRLDGQERILCAGQALVIPPGVPHAVWSPDAAGSRAIGEFRPALDTQAMFVAFFEASLGG